MTNAHHETPSGGKHFKVEKIFNTTPTSTTPQTGEHILSDPHSEQNIEIILMTMFYMACCYSAFAAVMCTRRIFKISRSSRVTESAPLGTASPGVSGKATEA